LKVIENIKYKKAEREAKEYILMQRANKTKC